MPAGSMELYIPKKTRKRYTVIDENSIEFINQEHYAGKDMIRQYHLYFLRNNIDIEDLYLRHMYQKDAKRQELWCSLPPEVRRNFHKYFFLKCKVLSHSKWYHKKLVMERTY